MNCIEEIIVDECCVCLEKPTNMFKFECNHIFCYKCISKLKYFNVINCLLCNNILIIKSNVLSKNDILLVLNDCKLNKEQYKKYKLKCKITKLICLIHHIKHILLKF